MRAKLAVKYWLLRVRIKNLKRLKRAVSLLLRQVARKRLIALDTLKTLFGLVAHIAIEVVAFVGLCGELHLRL